MTTRPRLYKTEGIVLRVVPVGEADRLVTLYTRDRGKLRAAARGVRRPTSKLGGHLDVLNRVSVALARGRSLDVITGADALESFRLLKADLDRLSYGLFVAEVVDAITPEESPGYRIFALVVETLRLLATSDNPRPVLHSWQLRILELAGFLPELRVCVNCRKEPSQGKHRYAIDAGGVVCHDCVVLKGPVSPLSTNSLKVLRFLAGHGIADAQRLRIPSDIDREVTNLLAGSIRHVLERDVRSAALIDRLRQLQLGVTRTSLSSKPTPFPSSLAPMTPRMPPNPENLLH